MTKEINNCICCGGMAMIIKVNKRWYVTCTKCGFNNFLFGIGFKSMQGAIKSWNIGKRLPNPQKEVV